VKNLRYLQSNKEELAKGIATPRQQKVLTHGVTLSHPVSGRAKEIKVMPSLKK